MTITDTFTPVTFEVVGLPSPQGSKTRMPNGAMLDGKSPEARNRHTSWRGAVADAARDIAGDASPLDGPLELVVEFRFPMPASRSKAIREAGRNPKTSAPDLDKLVRSTGDALEQSGLVSNDARFVDTHSSKFEVVGWTGAIITIRRWEP